MNQEPKKSVDSGRGTDANRDPITKTPGAHPVGTGVGAAGSDSPSAASFFSISIGPPHWIGITNFRLRIAD